MSIGDFMLLCAIYNEQLEFYSLASTRLYLTHHEVGGVLSHCKCAFIAGMAEAI